MNNYFIIHNFLYDLKAVILFFLINLKDLFNMCGVSVYVESFNKKSFSEHLGLDYTPGWLHVPVHPLLWRADHGAVEVCFAQETHPHFLSSPCRCGLLSR